MAPRWCKTIRPFTAAELGPPVRVLLAGRGISRPRSRDHLAGQADARRQPHFARFAAVNFLNPERKVQEKTPGTAPRLDLGDDRQSRPASICGSSEATVRHARIDTNVVKGEIDLATLGDDAVAFDGGMLGRKLSVYRLPEQDWSRRVTFEHSVTFTGGADLPVYVRVTQADGNQAWSSPIYLIE